VADSTFTTVPWVWEASTGPNGWVFVSLPEDLSDAIAETGRSGGFGAVRVEVTCGSTTWRTSVFPDSGRGCYVLPVKKAVRSAEGIEVGSEVTLHLALVDG
jgi:hypothetical protein